jgi:hypothetical protein
MDDNTTMTATITAIHEYYLTSINSLVEDGREDLIADLAADYDVQLRLARSGERAA